MNVDQLDRFAFVDALIAAPKDAAFVADLLLLGTAGVVVLIACWLAVEGLAPLVARLVDRLLEWADDWHDDDGLDREALAERRRQLREAARRAPDDHV